MTAIARHNGKNVVDLPGTAFQNGYTYKHWNRPQSLKHLAWKGNVYIGFRDAPTALYADEVFRGGRKILFVRDPRDVLVSEYFSNAYSHSLPQTAPETSEIASERERAIATNINEYVLSRAKALDATAEAYRPLIGDETVKILRYEDFIFRKADLCAEIATHFAMSAPTELVANVLSWADVFPAS